MFLEFGSFEVMWMDLESVIQSEVNIYQTLMRIHEASKAPVKSDIFLKPAPSWKITLESRNVLQGWQRTVRNLDPASGISVF